jgi:hypothetical protein
MCSFLQTAFFQERFPVTTPHVFLALFELHAQPVASFFISLLYEGEVLQM